MKSVSNIKLYKGDCLTKMEQIHDKSVDLILTDPPYGITPCKWDSVIPFVPMWEQLNRIIKDQGVIALFGSEPFSSALRMSNIKKYKYDWIWDKKLGGNPLNAKKQPLKTIENISIFYGKQSNYFPIMKTGKLRMKGGCKKQPEHTGKVKINFATESDQYYPTQLLTDFSTGNFRRNRAHPTQKPVALLEYLIKTYTLEGETVLDFTMGSGSTGVACINMRRDFIGIEKDETYFNIAKERIEKCQNEIKRKLF